MLTLNAWLLIATIASLSIQGIQLGKLKQPTPSWILAITAILVVTITYLIGDFIAGQNILAWHKFAAEQQQTIQIVVMLDISLAVFLGCNFIPISSLFALAYGQLLLFQQGWFNWPFQWQGALYGMAVVCLLITNLMFSKVEIYWSRLIFAFVLLCTILSCATPPQQSSIFINWQEMWISLASLLGIIATGSVITRFKKTRLKNRINK